MPNYDETDYDEWDDTDPAQFPNPACWACGGRGWVVRCPDDLCHGQDECIHGDRPSPCYQCNRDGLFPDEH